MAKRKKDTRLAPISPPATLADAERFVVHVLSSDDPRALLSPLAPHDVLAMLRAADDEQACELLENLDPDQTRAVIDLDCWSGDRPDTMAVARLLEPLIASGLDGATRAYDGLEDELRTLLFKERLIVHLREDKDEEVPAADGSELIRCADGYYFIEIPDPDVFPDVLRQLLAALINKPFEEYQRELESLRHDLISDLEESALRWRRGRLADIGFATREEAVGLLSPRDPRDVERALEGERRARSLPEGFAVPAVISVNLAGSALLDEAGRLLRESGDPNAARKAQLLPAELAAMTATYVAAVGCDLADFEAMAAAARFARDTLTLGLEAICGGDPVLGARALEGLAPGTIFQAAMGVLCPLRARARKVIADPRLAFDGVAAALLDPPHRVTVELLARDVPARWPALEEGRGASPDPLEPLAAEITAFSTMAQVAFASALLEEAELVAGLVARLGGADPIVRAGGDLACASVAVMTGLANSAAGRPVSTAPVAADEAKRFAALALAEEAERMCEDALAVIEGAIGAAGSATAAEARLIGRLVEIGRARLERGGVACAVVTR